MGISVKAIEWSIFFAALHLILETVFLKFEANAVECGFWNYVVVCFNARQGWLPFMQFIKPKDHLAKVIIDN